MRRTKHVEELIEDDEQKPDFDDMMNEVQEEIEEHDAGQPKRGGGYA